MTGIRDQKLIGIYALITPGADPKEHSITLELRKSTLVRFASESEPDAIDEVMRWVDRSEVHLIELGGGWSHGGVARLAELVGERSLVTARWFPKGELPEGHEGKIHRANVFFCSTPDVSASLETPGEIVQFVGINGPEHGIEMCERLVNEQKVQVIEVCSDWGFSGAAQVQEAVGPEVKVGVSLHQALDSGRRAERLYVPLRFEDNQTLGTGV